MSDGTKIQWTDATWNIASGCTKVSAGCARCYIERTPPFRMAHRRFEGGTGDHGIGATTGVLLHEDRLTLPLRWRKPRRIFVNALSDLFHEAIPDEFIARVWAVMAATPWHVYQILSKRPGRMRALLNSETFRQQVMSAARELDLDYPKHMDGGGLAQIDWPLPNVWLGVSVEDQAAADLRIPTLLRTPAAVRFLSCEPLLGPVNLGFLEPCDHARLRHEDIGCWMSLDWVICGGESGPGARPMHPQWARDLRDQCAAAGVPYFFKQWGEWVPAPWQAPRGSLGATHAVRVSDGYVIAPTHKPWSPERSYRCPDEWSGIARVGKKAAGRTLDGRTHDEFPDTA